MAKDHAELVLFIIQPLWAPLLSALIDFLEGTRCPFSAKIPIRAVSLTSLRRAVSGIFSCRLIAIITLSFLPDCGVSRPFFPIFSLSEFSFSPLKETPDVRHWIDTCHQGRV